MDLCMMNLHLTDNGFIKLDMYDVDSRITSSSNNPYHNILYIYINHV